MSIRGTEPGPEDFPGPERVDGREGVDGFVFDRALTRLEDVLLALPFDRALPGLDVLLARAAIPSALVHRDERILKVLHEAVVARPFGQLDEVQRIRAEVELCTLEVEVLTDRLREHAGDPDALERVNARLAEVHDRLEEVRGRL